MAGIYTTVRAASRDEFVERRSRFIGHVFPVTTEEEALARLDEVRREFRDASHNVYAYILREGSRQRYSDDGEPQGTAGLPVLTVLQGEGLTDVCAVVTRYFGGILLGGGGLVRAYTQGAKIAVEAAGKRVLRECVTFCLCADYSLYGSLTRLTASHGAAVVESDFGALVSLTLRLPEERYDAFAADVRDLSAGALIPDVLSRGWADIE